LIAVQALNLQGIVDANGGTAVILDASAHHHPATKVLALQVDPSFLPTPEIALGDKHREALPEFE